MTLGRILKKFDVVCLAFKIQLEYSKYFLNSVLSVFTKNLPKWENSV